MSEELKRRVYEILEPSTVKDPASKAYDFLMTLAVIVGLIPMMLKHENSFVIWIDVLTSLLMDSDYIQQITKWVTRVIKHILHMLFPLWRFLICCQLFR